ncbi:MAG: Ig-like domain-containing protein [Planctomycetales bacterium]|nr:Ig-like domain-containing protein [Planctomycetales bacterium]
MSFPPSAADDAAWLAMDSYGFSPVLENDSASDSPLDPSTVQIASGPAHGAITVDPDTGDVYYFPVAGFSGTDFFIYTVKNVDGQESNEATVYLVIQGPPPEEDPPTNDPPVIVGFGWANYSGTVYVFSGQVMDEHPAGLTVTFGGTLEGFSATTAADGTFTFSKVLGPEDMGLVSASTVDNMGSMSSAVQTVTY